MTTKQFDEARSEAFAGEIMGVLNAGSLALMTSIGHEVGLFDTMSNLQPATSESIAREAGLNERYVREWLAAMVTGRFIEYRREDRTYSLPAEHAAWLTRAAGSNNLAVQAQYIPMLALVQDGIIESFRNGGGVPYSKFESFQTLMAEDSATVHDNGLIDQILPLVPGLVERLQAGIDVLDVGCGSGHAVNLMAQAFPNSRFAGYDFSAEAIETGKREASAKGLTNVRLEARDVARLDDESRYDLITAFDAIHDQAQPAVVLDAISKALRPDGDFLMVDIASSSEVDENLDHPLAPFLYTVSTMHCMTVSLALGGSGLGTMWGEQLAVRMLGEAGFNDVAVQRIDGDPINAYYVARKG